MSGFTDRGLQDLEDRYKHGIVKIYVVVNGRPRSQGFTGFIVNRQPCIVCTCAHPLPSRDRHVLVQLYGCTLFFPFDVLRIDRPGDIMLLISRNLLMRRPVALYFAPYGTQLRASTSIWTISHLAGKEWRVSNGRCRGPPERVGGDGTQYRETMETFDHDMHVVKGSSGAPVMDVHGSVFGMQIFILKDHYHAICMTDEERHRHPSRDDWYDLDNLDNYPKDVKEIKIARSEYKQALSLGSMVWSIHDMFEDFGVDINLPLNNFITSSFERQFSSSTCPGPVSHGASRGGGVVGQRSHKLSKGSEKAGSMSSFSLLEEGEDIDQNENDLNEEDKPVVSLRGKKSFLLKGSKKSGSKSGSSLLEEEENDQIENDQKDDDFVITFAGRRKSSKMCSSTYAALGDGFAESLPTKKRKRTAKEDAELDEILAELEGGSLTSKAEQTHRTVVDKLTVSNDFQVDGAVLEVKVVEGHGSTIEVAVVNGVLHEGDQIVVCGLQGPIVTTIRALLTPHPRKELRVKGIHLRRKEIKAGQGIKISAQGLEPAIAGTGFYVVGPDDNVELIKELAMEDVESVLSKIDESGEGVCVQASSIGSLRALLEILESPAVNIPASGIGIGPVHKRDVMRASVMLEKKREYAAILAFDVKVTPEAWEYADEAGVKIFIADSTYHLFDQFKAYIDYIKEEERREVADEAVFPCVLKIIPNCVFNEKEPIVLEVDVLEGTAKVGTPICIPSHGFIDIGRIASIENKDKSVIVAKKEQKVAIKIVGSSPEEQQKMYGRHFDSDDELVSHISRRSIDVRKANFWNGQTNEDWRLVEKLEKLFKIK